MPAVLNAANEVAVNAFLNQEIGFSDIARIVERTMDAHSVAINPELDDIIDADRQARIRAEDLIRNIQTWNSFGQIGSRLIECKIQIKSPITNNE